MGFRTQDGLDLKRFKEGFGQDLTIEPPDILSSMEKQGRLKIKGGKLIPTMEGMAVADERGEKGVTPIY